MPRRDEKSVLAAIGEAPGKSIPSGRREPAECGDIGMKIRRDGTWSYQGSPIGRKPLVKLFASVLRKEEDGFYLVTPVEKVRIEVEGTPFVAVEMWAEGSGKDRRLSFRTNIDEVVTVDSAHRLGFDKGATGGFVPFIVVRDGLAARLTRPVYYDLAALANKAAGTKNPGVWSGGAFFPFPAGEAVD